MKNELIMLDEAQKNLSYCSFEPKTQDEKLMLYNALQKCDYRVSDKLNTVISIKNVFVQQFEQVDKETGEAKVKRRSIVFDENNKTYVTASSCFYYSLSRLISVIGEPKTWEKPLKVKFIEQNLNNGGKGFVIEPIIDSPNQVQTA